MKNKASTFIQQVLSVIVNMVKAKSMEVKKKTDAIKTRLLIFRLLRNKKLVMNTISHKIHALTGQEKEGSQNNEDSSKSIVPYNSAKDNASPNQQVVRDEKHDYPDPRHSIFGWDNEDGDDEICDGTSSVINLVKNSKENDSDFNLEDEIDHVADVFIRRFHRQMKMQKLESFKRYQEMM